MSIIKFISDQTEVPHFHRECEIYEYNFMRMGIFLKKLSYFLEERVINYPKV